MYYYNRTLYSIIALLLGLQLLSCKKFLDEKPDKKLAVPASLRDAQLLLDNNGYMNHSGASMAELISDNYYITTASYNATSVNNRAHYIWDANAETQAGNWLYGQVFFSNIALETTDKITVTLQNEALWKEVRGAALFFRANQYYEMAHLFTPPYNKATAATDMGLPLRLSAGIDDPTERASVQDTWNMIVADLQDAIRLLPVTSAYKTRPNRVAAYALLARTYLDTEDYTRAALYADSSLQLYSTLIDFNTVNAASATPFTIFNNEVVFHSTTAGGNIVSASYTITDSVLYRSYANNDLRKTVFYTLVGGLPNFKGSYFGTNNAGVTFNGITTGEMYLTKAEALARTGDIAGAMNTLNSLLIKRWKTGTFVPYTAAGEDDALNKILAERRKELAFRGRRWMDLRRLNKDPRFAVTLKRLVNGVTYELPPNNLRYTLLIPQSVIDLSGIPQNPR